MSTRFRILSLLMALALSLAASSATAGDLIVQGDAARVFQRAEGFLQQKQYRKAATEFERASELSGGTCPECLLGVARAYSGAGQIDCALQATRMALPLFLSNGDRARAYNQLGSLLTLKGDTEAARTAFERALELDAGMEAQVRSSLAEALLKRAAHAKAAARKAAEQERLDRRGSGAP
jgi:tetratricopeptide (TPR) repeat protein